jgi:voltage-gated potassium channel
VRPSSDIESTPPHWPAWRKALHVVIFCNETPGGRAFDVALFITIGASVLAVMADSISSIHNAYGRELFFLEWAFTIAFTVEYALRLLSAPRPGSYARSFFGVVDLMSILPTYLSLLLPGSQYLQVIRIMRVLRVFRVLKLAAYIGEAEVLWVAIKNSRQKLMVFIVAVLAMAIAFGTMMYLVEGDTNGFTSIPLSIYWTIVTITTVGYGDIAPSTPLGQALASVIMLLGYAIVAVPTGIVTMELVREGRRSRASTCAACGAGDHQRDAAYCRRCGHAL